MLNSKLHKRLMSIVILLALLLLLIGIYFEPALMKHLTASKYKALHDFLEIIAIVIAFAAACVVFHSYKNAPGFIKPLGVMFLGIGFIDILHTLTFSNEFMLCKLNGGIEYTDVYWILGRFIGSIAFMVSGSLLVTQRDFPFSRRRAYGTSLTITFILILLTFTLVPDIILNVNDLTVLYKISVGFFIISIIFFLLGITRTKYATEYVSAYLLLFALTFMLVRGIVRISLVSGSIEHELTSAMFKLMAYIFVYVALVRNYINWPYRRINAFAN